LSTFVDTSALLAVICRADRQHSAGLLIWRELMAGDEPLIVTNYVLLELHAILQRRVGMDAVHVLEAAFLPVLDVHWIDEAGHEAAVSAYLAANRRALSLVDCASFQVMRERAIRRAFTFDPHFAEHGFEVIPPLPDDRPTT
jgi:predicted nucleic acid-binding protein